MENNRIVQLGNFKELLEGASTPFPDTVRQSLITFLKADSRRVGQAYRDQQAEELARAEAEGEQLQNRVEGNQARLNRAENMVQSLQPGSWLMGVVSSACFILCFAAEYVFNNAVMPWLVSVSPKSLLGIALSMAPATAPVILDRVIVGLFDVYDSWDAVKDVLTPLNRFARHTLRLGFLAAVGGLNLYAIWLLAGARGVASFLKNSDGVTAITMAQQGKIDMALLMVSIAVTIDGALFYLFGLHETRAAQRRFKAKRELAALEAIQLSLETKRSTVAADLASQRRRWEDIDSLQQSVAEAYFAEGMVRLEETESTARPAQELALQILGRPAALTAVKASGEIPAR